MMNLYRLSPKIAVSVILTSFILIMVYVKLGALSGEDWSREHLIERLFEEPLLHKLYYGALTTLSEWFLCGTVAICFSSASALAAIAKQHRIKQYKNILFLLMSGCLLGLFLIDDTFRITLYLTSHSSYLKVFTYFIYSLFIIGYSVAFRRQIKSMPYASLMIPIALLAISGLADITDFPQRPTPIAATAKLLLEDGTKLFALASLLLYFCQVCQTKIVQALVLIQNRSFNP